MSRGNTLRSPGASLPPPHRRNVYVSVQETVQSLLTERECNIFNRGLSGYRQRNDVGLFVQALTTTLNTNRKRNLLIDIRDTFVKPSDYQKFNRLAMKNGLAVSREGGTAKKPPSAEKTLERERNQSGMRKVDVKRDKMGEWGFSVRGGSEHGIGVFVSWVDPGSQAQKVGLQAGDQILKINDTNFEGISHYEATQTLKSCRKAKLWLKTQGVVPDMQYATQSYRWIDGRGRPVSPPPEKFKRSTDTGSLRGDSKMRLDADERKVSLMVEEGKELGISIRGGTENGLGIYISKVDEGSVAENYGLKAGDQLLEVNGISFVKILHSEAAKALRAQRLMVVKVKDVGKIPHSRVTAIGQTQWHSSPSTLTKSKRTRSQERILQEEDNDPVFSQGAGTQVMLIKSSSPNRGIMNEVARSLLSKEELSSFKYYVTQYEQSHVTVHQFTNALLHILNTGRKMQLVSEVRNIIRGDDLEQFNELTIHKEIEARKQNGRSLGSTRSLNSDSSNEGRARGRDYGSYTIQAEASFHPQEDRGSPQLLTIKQNDHDSLDRVPHRLTPASYSTPNNDFTATMNERRRKVHPNSTDSQILHNAWDETDMSPGNSMIDEKVLQIKIQEAEEKLKQEFEEKQRELLEDQARRIKEEEQQRFEEEKAELEQRIAEMGNESKDKMEEEIWQQAEETMRKELEEAITKETTERLREEYELQLQKKLAEKLKRTDSEVHRKKVSRLEEQEQLRIEVEEQIKAETEERMRLEYEEKLERESEEKARLAEEVQSYRKLRENLEREKSEKQKLEKAKKEAEKKARREAEEKEHLEQLLREAEEKAEQERQLREEEQARWEEENYQRERDEQRRKQKEEEMEKKRQREEEKRAEQERRMQREQERKRREEEEEERIRQEEERMRQEEEEERMRQEEEERMRQEEEERMMQEEEERMRQEEERMRQEEEEERLMRQEEERMRREEEEEREQRAVEHEKVQLRKKKQAAPAFDPFAMDDLILTSGSVSGGTAPSKSIGKESTDSAGKSKRQIIEEERRKAEKMLMQQMMRANDPPKEEGLSFGGYTGLKGSIVNVTVTKVSRKLGIAVEGGATTKNQKGVVIRQITPDGSAALTGTGLNVGQQILSVGGKSLKGLKHKEAVITIKNAFDGPMNKKIEFVVLETEQEDDY